MSLSAPAEHLRSSFLNWTMKAGRGAVRRDYALYHSFFTTLQQPERFWERLASCALAGKFVHYRFMAAVKYLLLAGDPHPVRELYPDLARGTSRLTPGELFQAFCDQHWERIVVAQLN
jgi:hypothetical protein